MIFVSMLFLAAAALRRRHAFARAATVACVVALGAASTACGQVPDGPSSEPPPVATATASPEATTAKPAPVLDVMSKRNVLWSTPPDEPMHANVRQW